MKKNHNFTAMRIYLIGYMASGKSNLGQILAEKLGYSFVDIDYLFEERFRISVLDFFEKYDEDGFRKIEQSLLLESTLWENVVVSTGGGTPCFFDNMQVIRESGISIYLKWHVAPLVHRLRQVKRKRPLLKDIPPEELEEKVTYQLKQREFYYLQADYIVDAGNLEINSLLDIIVPAIKGN
ncbi:MAG: shikimate kinase [Bacteroidota bacterium]